jgi:hypothetical protein
MVVNEPNLRTPVAGTGLYFDKGDSFDLDSLENQSCSVVDDDDSEDSSGDDDIPRPPKKSRITSFQHNIHLTPATVKINRGQRNRERHDRRHRVDLLRKNKLRNSNNISKCCARLWMQQHTSVSF